MNVVFLNLRKVIIGRLYLPLSQSDSWRGFWQDIKDFDNSQLPELFSMCLYSIQNQKDITSGNTRHLFSQSHPNQVNSI